MASTKISDMTAGTTMAGAVLPVVQGGVNKKVDSNLFTISNSLGSFTYPITISSSGYYTDYTLASNIQVTFAESGHVEGQVKYVMITCDGTNTIAFIKPTAYNLYIASDFVNNQLMSSGTYLFAFTFLSGSIKISLQFISAITDLQQSAVFNGTSSYVVADEQHTELEFSSAGTDAAFSVSFWIKPSSIPASAARLVRIPYSTGVAHWEVLFNTTGKIVILTFGDTVGSVYLQCTSTTTLSVDTWYNIVITYDASEANTGFEIYINSTIEAAPTRGGAGVYTGMNTATSTSRLNIGRAENNTLFYPGLLDELAIWSKELTQLEVTELYNSGAILDLSTHSAAANLELWMRFINNVIDDSVNEFTFTNSGATFSTDHV